MDRESVARRRGRIVVEGPLASFADGLREDLAGQGFATDTIVDHVHRLADLSGWLHARGFVPAALTGEVVRDFLQERRVAGIRVGVSGRALAPLLGYLRRSGIVPPPSAVVATTPAEVFLAEYQRYLDDERGLAAGTVKHYLRCARMFLAWLPGPVERSLPALSAGQVVDFVRDWTTRRRSTTLDMVTLPALRSLLRFVHLAGGVGRGGAGRTGPPPQPGPAGWSPPGGCPGGVGRLRPGQRGRPPGLRDPADAGPVGGAGRRGGPAGVGRRRLAGR
jgi:integrase/recombinase XerD